MTYRLHRRQFIIDRESHRIHEDWISVPIGNGLILSHCPDLSLKCWQTAEGETAFLIGLAIGVSKSQDKQTAMELIAESYHWAGQWGLIVGNKLYGDATGLLGVYAAWRTKSNVIISSSLALLSLLLPERRRHPRQLGWFGMGWHTPPSSRLEGVIKLLPDMGFDFTSASVFRHEKARPAHYSALSADQISDHLIEKIATILHELKNDYERIVIPLTAGYDSRMILAIAQAQDIKVETMTFLHPAIQKSDAKIPYIISQYTGVPHNFILFSSLKDAKLTALYDAHTFRNIADADRYYFIRGMFHWAKAGMAVVRTTGIGLCRAYYHAKLKYISWDQLMARPDLPVRRFRDWGSRSVETAELKRWLRWRQNTPLPMDWQDLMYRDQRMCGWLSAVEQSVDLTPATFLQIANNTEIYDLLTALPAEERLAGNLQKRMIRKLSPGLADIPFNPPMDGMLGRHWLTLDRERHRIPTELRNIWRYKSHGWHEDWGRDPLSGLP